MIREESAASRLAVVAAMAVAALSGCVEERPLIESTASFRVLVSGDIGGEKTVLPFPDAPIEIELTVEALSNTGAVRTALTGPVALFVQPGRIQQGTSPLARVELEDGVGTTKVSIDKMYGATHVCAEDNLGDEPSFAVGCSRRLEFEMPSIAQVQLTDDNTVSPLEGAFIDVGGDIVVTGVFVDGFYATDLAAEPVSDRPGDFGSIFVFSHSYPNGIELGDRLSSISGTVQVFVGSTQLVFPSWIHRANAPRGREHIPEPVEITAKMCAAASGGNNAGLCGHLSSNLDMESLESSLVVLRGARTPTRWVDCDLNRDGRVANFDPRCNQQPIDPAIATHCAEIACNSQCNLDKTCSELSSFRQYGQWAVTLDGGDGPKINVVTREGLPEFDPLAAENRGILMDVTGNLRHSLPARPRWLVLARDADDVTIHRDE